MERLSGQLDLLALAGQEEVVLDTNNRCLERCRYSQHWLVAVAASDGNTGTGGAGGSGIVIIRYASVMNATEILVLAGVAVATVTTLLGGLIWIVNKQVATLSC